MFRKMPKDLTEPTFFGALGINFTLYLTLVSIICTAILGTLLVGEISAYLKVETKSDMLVDITHHDKDRLNINIDIEFPRMPCDLMSLDITDIMGTHVVDIGGSLYKKRLGSNGEFLSISIFKIDEHFYPISRR